MISREYLALAEQKPISWCVPVDFRLSVLTRSSWFQRRNLKNGYGKTAVRPTITERKMINRWLSFWSKRIKKWLVSRGFSAVVNMPAKLSFASSNLAGTSKQKGHPLGCPFCLEKSNRPDLKDQMQMSGGHLLEPGWTGSTPWFSSLWEENVTNLAGTRMLWTLHLKCFWG